MKKQLALLTLATIVAMPTSAFAQSQYEQYDPTFTEQQKQEWLANQGLTEIRALKQKGFSLVEPLCAPRRKGYRRRLDSDHGRQKSDGFCPVPANVPRSVTDSGLLEVQPREIGRSRCDHR